MFASILRCTVESPNLGPWCGKLKNLVLSVCPRVSRFQEASRITRLVANQCMVFPLRPDVAVRRSRGGTEAACLPLWQPPPEIPRSQILQQGPLEILGAAQAGGTWRDALLNARMSLCSSTKRETRASNSQDACVRELSPAMSFPALLLPAPYLLEVSGLNSEQPLLDPAR